MRKKIKISKISALHYYKLFFRSALFIITLISYVIDRIKNNGNPLNEILKAPYIVSAIGIIYTLEMLLRFFPSNVESMGCQKQFKKNFIPTEIQVLTHKQRYPVITVAVLWIFLNGVIGLMYFIGLIDVGILILISLAYSVCDMICILFFCPFQTWFLKNKCCGSCRIYNWDYAMMFTPLIFIPGWYTYSILGIAVLLLVYWEIVFWRHPERFFEQTNDSLSCANCREKLCQHKTQLRRFLKSNKDLILTKGNAVIDKVIRKKK